MPALTCPRCGDPVEADALICMSCGENLSRQRAEVAVAGAGPVPAGAGVAGAEPDPAGAGVAGAEPDPAVADGVCHGCGAAHPAGAAVCAVCLQPLAVRAGLTLVITGEPPIQVAAGQAVLLGRDHSASPTADRFAALDAISRRHATVGCRHDGAAWVRDEGSTNGTYLNERRLPAGEAVPLSDGDRLRLASATQFTIRA